MKKTEISENAFFALINLLRCKDIFSSQALVGKPDDNATLYLAGRNELCDKRYIELSFDGTVSQSREFKRFAYSIINAKASMHFNFDDKELYYLLAPTEFVRVLKNQSKYILERCKRPDIPSFIKKNVYCAESGIVVTVRDNEKKTAQLQNSQKNSEERAKVLAEHLCFFFGKDENDA